MLWSINERLAGREGLEIERLGLGWVGDLIEILQKREGEADAADLEDELGF